MIQLWMGITTHHPSEDEGDSRDDEDPNPEPTEHSRGRKRLKHRIMFSMF